MVSEAYWPDAALVHSIDEAACLQLGRERNVDFYRRPQRSRYSADAPVRAVSKCLKLGAIEVDGRPFGR